MTVKIRIQLHTVIFGLLSFSTSNISYAQDSVLNKYGLWVIKDEMILKTTIRGDSNKRMMDICAMIPGLATDLRYATTNNFMGKKLYPSIATTYLRLPAAKALRNVQVELAAMGLALKIFDAYRPYSVTEKMWELVKDDRYAADPKKGSGHNRGIAVDVTIIDLANHKELDMGTGFDNFSDTAHHDFIALSKEIMKNRLLLKNTMEKNGFRPLGTEWWHYSLPNASYFELLDISFKKLKKISGNR